jgi:outer membrane protein TolC
MERAGLRAFGARIAEQSREAAEAKVSQARGAALPRLDADAQKIWFNDNVNKLAGISPQLPARVTTGALQVSQPIIGLGPLLLQIQAASLQADVARNDEATARKDARLQGAEAYIRAQKASQLVSIAEASLQVTENQTREAEALSRAGRLNKAESMRFELALADAKMQASQARITYELASVSLAEILGTPGAVYALETPADSRFEKQRPPLPELGAALKEAAEKRPESKNAAAGIQISEYYKLASNLDYLPSLNAFARYERNFEAKDAVFPAGSPAGKTYPKEDIQDTFSYGLQLKWSIWDWGTRWNRSSEYASNLQRARVQKEAVESGVRLDVTSAVLSLRGAVDTLETSKTSVRLAEEVFKLTKARFQQGQATTTDVISAERDQTRARGGLVNARGDVDIAWLKYQKSTGVSPETK